MKLIKLPVTVIIRGTVTIKYYFLGMDVVREIIPIHIQLFMKNLNVGTNGIRLCELLSCVLNDECIIWIEK